MNLHCSQTSLQPIRPPKSLIPYEFALLSNRLKDFKHTYKFDSPTNLHCSQTTKIKRNWPLPFDSPTNLHCSQTEQSLIIFARKFDSPTNLHCSQTGIKIVPQARSLIPLRICTALKPVGISSIFFIVWFPYEFALLSNPVQHGQLQLLVWFPYEFALLSNDFKITHSVLLFDSPTNLHCSQTI